MWRSKDKFWEPFDKHIILAYLRLIANNSLRKQLTKLQRFKSNNENMNAKNKRNIFRFNLKTKTF